MYNFTCVSSVHHVHKNILLIVGKSYKKRSSQPKVVFLFLILFYKMSWQYMSQ
jgi:hypothetical protein